MQDLTENNLQDAVFKNNKARYGPNIASFGQIVQYEDSSLVANSERLLIKGVVSGKEFPNLRFHLLDPMLQLVNVQDPGYFRLRLESKDKLGEDS